MDDAERDAWLREALRHAPDSGALPPNVVSDAILAEARAAAARPAAGAAPRRAPVAPANLLLALWSWLARPPVAAGFASVMAATLVGLMWWDRPMDETLPRPPARELNEAKRGTASAPVDAAVTAAAPNAPTGSTTPAAPAREARSGDSANAERTRAKDDTPAKERGALRKNDAPAAFPSAEAERVARPARQGAAQDAKKEAAATPAPATSPAPFAAAERAAPPTAAPAAPVIAPTPQQSGRLASDEGRLAASNRADVGAAAGAMAKSAAPSGSVAEPARGTAPPAAAAPLARQRSIAEARPSEVDAFASSGAGARSEQQAAGVRRDGAAEATPIAPLLGTLADNGTRWTRRTANGGSTAIEPAWRDWLADLDAAARWRRVADFRQPSGTDAEKQGTTALRLDLDGRPGAFVRLDGTTARVEILGAEAAYWQATLAPAAAERLRAALARLPP